MNEEMLYLLFNKILVELKQINVNTTKVKKQPVKEKDDGKTLFLDFVRLTLDQYLKLTEKFGEPLANQKIDKLNEYGHKFKSKFAKYDSHYHTILSWSRKDEGDDGDGLTDYDRAERDEK